MATAQRTRLRRYGTRVLGLQLTGCVGFFTASGTNRTDDGTPCVSSAPMTVDPTSQAEINARQQDGKHHKRHRAGQGPES